MKSLYDAVKFGRLAYADCVDPKTGTVVPMLAIVGDQESGSFDVSKVFPIAYFIESEEESLSYGIANGNGQYITRERDLGIFDGTNTQLPTPQEEEGTAEEGAGTA